MMFEYANKLCRRLCTLWFIEPCNSTALPSFMNSKCATKKKIKSKCDLGGALWQKVTGILIMTVVGPPCLCQSIQGKIKSVDADETVTFHNKKLLLLYSNSLVNVDSFYTNFTKATFQKIPIPHLTCTMKHKFLSEREFLFILYYLIPFNLLNTIFG